MVTSPLDRRWTIVSLNGLTERSYPRAVKLYLWLHCSWFAGYAFFGKGFAYAGYPPVYVGEFLLVLAVFALFLTQRSAAPLLTPIGTVMACFVVWQITRMVPYVEVYGLDAFRDSVIWAYCAFAWAVAAMILRIRRPMRLVLNRYRSFARLYLIIGPIAWLATLYLADRLPNWPGTTVTVPMIKGGDYAVQLSGIFAFSTLGLAGGGMWWTVVTVAEGALGMTSRGGMVAFLAACAFALAARPRVGRLLGTVVVALTVIAVMAALDIRFTPPGATRELSVDVLTRSMLSVVTQSESADLESTKGWRLNWWGRIADYTVNGPYFWTGKGYGINLADSDGFQVGTAMEPLRSPHNSHLTFLARSGVPGFCLWAALQLTWLLMMLRSYFRARNTSQTAWMALFAWVIAFWLAFMVDAAFDVSLEGPMAGIPFWTIFGIGWGAHMILASSVGGSWRSQPS